MSKITKRVVDSAEVREKDYVIWDDELPGFGLGVFASGKRSYVIQYRSGGRSRRCFEHRVRDDVFRGDQLDFMLLAYSLTKADITKVQGGARGWQ